MASITKRGNKWRAFIAYTTYNGAKKRISGTFATQKEAKEWASKEEVKINGGYNPNMAKIPFAEYYVQWIETYKRPTVRESTIIKYNTYAKDISEIFGSQSLSKLTPTIVQNAITKFGNTHALETTKNLTSTIKASLQDAYVDGYIERDIYSRVKAVSSKKTAQFQNYLEADEFERLQRYLYATVKKSDQFHLLVLLALETGARLGELLALTRPDFTGNAIDINKSYSNSVKAVTLPKNKSSIRTITLSTRMSEVLEWYIKQNNNNDLFPHWSNQTIQNNLVRILKEAHSHPIKFHGLRHSHVSYLLHNGVDITYISKRVGHSNTAITIQVYSHMLKEKEQVQNELALNILDNLGKNT